MPLRQLVCAALLILLGQTPLLAQQRTPARDSTQNGKPFLATAEMLFINVGVNRMDAWAFNQDWARVKPSSWWRNLRLGWEWDENEFGTNMFSHPYHGGLYFNAGRANGLDYWESVPLAFLGSFTWEYFGEKYRPALNDFFMTAFGGIALGELFHRVGASIRDNQDTGKSRTLREIAALPSDPTGAANRLARGEWKRTFANPPEHSPEGYVLRVGAGLRLSADSANQPLPDVPRSSVIVADLSYGDPFRKRYELPFDVFSVRLQVSPDAGELNLLRASGRLFGHDLNRPLARNRHVIAINQRYDFVQNPANKFGSQSVELGLYSRWHLGKESGLRTQAFADVIMMGALDAPYAGFGERTYDFGPGAGFRTEINYERKGVTYFHVFRPHGIRALGEWGEREPRRELRRIRVCRPNREEYWRGPAHRILQPAEPLFRPAGRIPRVSRGALVSHVDRLAAGGAATMRIASARLLLALFALCALAPGRASAQRWHRSGFWFEDGSGPASIRVGCSGCPDVTRRAGTAGYFRIGSALSDRIGIGLETFSQSANSAWPPTRVRLLWMASA